MPQDPRISLPAEQYPVGLPSDPNTHAGRIEWALWQEREKSAELAAEINQLRILRTVDEQIFKQMEGWLSARMHEAEKYLDERNDARRDLNALLGAISNLEHRIGLSPEVTPERIRRELRGIYDVFSGV